MIYGNYKKEVKDNRRLDWMMEGNRNMESYDKTNQGETGTVPWQKTVAKYQDPDTRRSWWQVINTLVPVSYTHLTLPTTPYV